MITLKYSSLSKEKSISLPVLSRHVFTEINVINANIILVLIDRSEIAVPTDFPVKK